MVGGRSDDGERKLRQSGTRKSRWQNGYWVTLVALLCGLVAIGIGIGKPALFQIKVVGFEAVATVVLSAGAIVMTIWQIEQRSRRLRQPLFWASILVNLALIGAVTVAYYRGMNMPRLERGNEGTAPPSMPEAP